MADDLFTTITEAEARLGGCKGDPRQAGFQLTQIWPLIDASLAPALIVTLNATTTITGPKADGVAYSGTFQVSSIGSEGLGNRSVTIFRRLTKTNAIADIAALNALTPLITGLRDIDHPFGDAGGYTTHAANSFTAGIIFTYKYLAPASFAIINALTDAEFYSLSGITGTPNELLQKRLTEAEDHTLTLELGWRRVGRRTWTTSPAIAPDFTEPLNTGTAVLAMVRHFLGYDKTQHSTIMTDLANGGSSGVLTGYLVTDIQVQENDDGSKSYIQTMKQAVERTYVDSFVDRYGTSYIYSGINAEQATIDAITAIMDATTNNSLSVNASSEFAARHNYSASRAPYDPGWIPVTWSIGDVKTSRTIDFERIQAKNGKWYVRLVYWDEITETHASYNAARSAITAQPGSQKSSFVRQLNALTWQSVCFVKYKDDGTTVIKLASLEATGFTQDITFP